jgi:hypothetical protein
MRIQQLTPRGDPQGDDTGAVAVVVALLLTLIMVLAAFALDIGNAYAQGRQLSVAADADSLAAAAAVGNAMPRTVGAPSLCTQATLDSLTDSAGHVGAQAIGKAAADAMNTANNKTGVSEPVDSVTVSCVPANPGDTVANAIEVRVDNSRGVKTAIAGVIGISTITPNSYAVARYVRAKSAGGLRPWAVCDSTMKTAQGSPGTTFWTGIDWMPGDGTGPCSTTAAGNWGAVDFNSGSNGAGDLANWTMYGYPGSVQIPSTQQGDPGVSNKSELRTAFSQLVGDVTSFPIVTGFTCSSTPCSGSNAQFAVVGIGTVRVCGIVYGNNTYNVDQSTGTLSTCWVDPSPPTSDTTTTTQSATTSIAMPVGSLTLNILQPDLPSVTPPANVTVSVLMTGVLTGNKDFNATVATFTSTTQADLSTAPDKIIPAGTPVTITTTTVTGTGGFGPYVYSGNQWNLKDHIQFRWVSYSTDSYSGSIPTPCDFTDQMCVGITQLWK